MIGFIGTSLQLQSIIASHTFNPFWMHMTPVWRMLYEESLPSELSWTEPTSMRTECRSPWRRRNCPSVCCYGNLFLATCYLATTPSLLFVAAGTCWPNCSTAMDARSGSTIPPFRRHVTIAYDVLLISFALFTSANCSFYSFYEPGWLSQ
jgi:hypothetical protein